MKVKSRQWYRVDVEGLDNTMLVKKVETDNWVIYNEGLGEFDVAHDDELLDEYSFTNWRECDVRASLLVIELTE
jgi:hypothetical protein